MNIHARSRFSRLRWGAALLAFLDSGDVERVGPGINGSSAQCGVVDKDNSNTCGQ